MRVSTATVLPWSLRPCMGVNVHLVWWVPGRATLSSPRDGGHLIRSWEQAQLRWRVAAPARSAANTATPAPTRNCASCAHGRRRPAPLRGDDVLVEVE